MNYLISPEIITSVSLLISLVPERFNKCLAVSNFIRRVRQKVIQNHLIRWKYKKFQICCSLLCLISNILFSSFLWFQIYILFLSLISYFFLLFKKNCGSDKIRICHGGFFQFVIASVNIKKIGECMYTPTVSFNSI